MKDLKILMEDSFQTELSAKPNLELRLEKKLIEVTISSHAVNMASSLKFEKYWVIHVGVWMELGLLRIILK